jgi:hypothetical protein
VAHIGVALTLIERACGAADVPDDFRADVGAVTGADTTSAAAAAAAAAAAVSNTIMSRTLSVFPLIGDANSLGEGRKRFEAMPARLRRLPSDMVLLCCAGRSAQPSVGDNGVDPGIAAAARTACSLLATGPRKTSVPASHMGCGRFLADDTDDCTKDDCASPSALSSPHLSQLENSPLVPPLTKPTP